MRTNERIFDAVMIALLLTCVACSIAFTILAALTVA